jgi:hypothetical protein
MLHCFHVDPFVAAKMALSWSAASVDVVAEGLSSQNILNIQDTRRAFLWYENVHVASNAPVARNICRKSCIHEDEAYLSWEEERSSSQTRSAHSRKTLR